jgi:hypothetical protein
MSDNNDNVADLGKGGSNPEQIEKQIKNEMLKAKNERFKAKLKDHMAKISELNKALKLENEKVAELKIDYAKDLI